MGSTRQPIPKQPEQLRCFISAPFGCNVDVVITALNGAGIHSFRTDEIRLGDSWIGAIRKNIEDSDFVCVVLANSFENSATLFELVAAVGAGLPVLILVEDKVRLPSDLASLLYVRVALDKPETVRTAVHGFVRSFRKG